MVGLKRRLVAAEMRQRDIANRDALTGVGNRRFFEATMRRELSARTRPRGRRGTDDSPLALLLLDLDDFKGVNDRTATRSATRCSGGANRAESVLRSTDTLTRIGGDEFAVIAPGAQGEGAQRMAESIRTAVGLRESDAPGPIPSASVGWAVFPEDGRRLRDADARRRRTDAAAQARQRRPRARSRALGRPAIWGPEYLRGFCKTRCQGVTFC